MDDGNGPNKVRNFYLQYPLRFRQDPDVRRLEIAFGIAAPMIWLEMNAYSADKDFIIKKRSNEGWGEQLVIDMNYDRHAEEASVLIEKVMEYCIAEKLVEEIRTEDGQEAVFFPWAKRQTMSRTADAEKQARYRERQQEKGACSSESITKGNVCYQSVTEVLPGVTKQVTGGNAGVTVSNECYHSKNKSIDKEKDIDIDREIDREAGGLPDVPKGPPPIPPPKNLVPLVQADGTRWVPTPDDWGKLVVGFEGLNLQAEFIGMDAWVKQILPGGHLYRGENPFMFTWRWLERSQHKRARILAQELAKERGYQVGKPQSAPADKGAEKARGQMASFAAALQSIHDEENNGGEGEG